MSAMSFDDIKKVFGSTDSKISNIILTLTISYPNITAAQIVSIFKESLEKYYSKDDEIIDKADWWNQKYSGHNMGWIQDHPADPKENLYTTKIFKNLYRIIDTSHEWDKQIKSKAFKNGLLKIKSDILKNLKKDYRNNNLQDKFEIICEFIDLVEKKVNSMK